MAQDDWKIGLTWAAKALLVTVLQSNEVPPPPEPLLLQDMLMKTNKIIVDVIAMSFLMFEMFLESADNFPGKITQKV